MTLPVFHHDSADQASVGSEVKLGGAEGHHAATVRRLRVGELLTVTDGRGTGLDAEVVHVGRHDVTVRITSSRTALPAAVAVTVVQALPKGDRAELAVELMTEVGVTRLVPWQSERSVSRWHGDRADKGRAKWQAAAASAAKQSRRLWWPVVDPLADTAQVAQLVKESHQPYVLHESAELALVEALDTARSNRPDEVTLIVGPEGGLTSAERAKLTDAGATEVRLGPHVLRTSTAGVVAATLVLARTDEWRAAPQ